MSVLDPGTLVPRLEPPEALKRKLAENFAATIKQRKPKDCSVHGHVVPADAYYRRGRYTCLDCGCAVDVDVPLSEVVTR